MAELLPPEVAKWQFVEEKARALLDAFSFREVRTAAVAPDGTPRPPGATHLARAYLAHAWWQREPVTRWYELGPVFRRMQEKVHQVPQLAGAVFGAAGTAAEVELVAMAAGLVAEAGVPAAATTTRIGGRGPLEPVRARLALLSVPTALDPPGDAPLTFTVAAEDVPLVTGSRADGLVTSLGGSPHPALIFTVDMGALVQAVPDPAESFLSPTAAVLSAEGPRASDWALATAHHLRLAGVRVEITGDPGARSRARLIVLARDEDLAAGKVTVEDLATGTRQEVSPDDLEATIRARLD